MAKPRPELPKLSKQMTERVVETTAETVRRQYVFAEDAERMAELLLSKQRQGAFASAGSIPDLARRITDTLMTVREDLHLAVMPWNGEAEQGGMHDTWKRRWLRHNYEFRALEILLGNVGYLDLRGFASALVAGPTATAAMQFLAHSDALIFDLRDNGGGEDLVYMLMSFLFDEARHVHTARHRDHDEQSWTYAYVPGPRFSDHPVYVLISRSTFSAGEDFSYNLQKLGRVIVVGEPTRGGAHPVEFYRFPELYLELMIPNAYSVNPVTTSNWEDCGVVPDVEAPADEALAVAHEHALTRLVEATEDDEARRFREWALETIRARRVGWNVPAERLALYAGRYTRSVVVEARDATLRLSWGGRRNHRLTPVSEHRFEFDHGTQRVTFSIDNGDVKSLLWETEEGDVWTMERLT